jgi:hypothetical protein
VPPQPSDSTSATGVSEVDRLRREIESLQQAIEDIKRSQG